MGSSSWVVLPWLSCIGSALIAALGSPVATAMSTSADGSVGVEGVHLQTSGKDGRFGRVSARLSGMREDDGACADMSKSSDAACMNMIALQHACTCSSSMWRSFACSACSRACRNSNRLNVSLNEFEFDFRLVVTPALQAHVETKRTLSGCSKNHSNRASDCSS